jgi:hypothetical protein
MQHNWARAPPSVDIPLVARAGSLHLLTTSLPAGVPQRFNCPSQGHSKHNISAFATFEPCLSQPECAVGRMLEQRSSTLCFPVSSQISGRKHWKRINSPIVPQLLSRVMPTNDGAPKTRVLFDPPDSILMADTLTFHCVTRIMHNHALVRFNHCQVLFLESASH